jgi:hypothetical protein
MNTGIFLFIAVLIFFVIPFALFVQLILSELLRVMPALPQRIFGQYSWLKETRNNSYW